MFLVPLQPNSLDAALCLRVAELLAPPVRMAPSRWVEQNIRLRREQTERPGLFSCAFRPWIRSVLDWRERWPGKRGLIIKKYAQSGITTAMLAAMVEMSAYISPRMLYVISTEEDAKDIVTNQIDRMIESCPEATKRFGAAVTEGEREIMLSKPYDGGRLDFVGSGSPAKVSSRPYCAAFVDELDQAMKNFPTHFGDLWGFIEGRQKAVTDPVRIAWSHPTFEGEGIDRLYRQLCHTHEWVFDCPACGGTIFPRWALVKYDVDGQGQILPDTARLTCPACAAAISDAQRVRACRDRDDFGTDGGTGRFESTMAAETGRQRELVGMWIHGLCDPNETVIGLARRWATKRSKAERMTFLNKTLGEEFAESESAITVRDVAACVRSGETLPGGPLGVQIVTVGVDVQFPMHNPTLYTSLCAFTGAGMLLVPQMHRFSGWLALQDWLRSVCVVTRDAAGAERRLVPQIVAVDAQGSMMQNVLDAARTPVYSSVSNARVQILPVQFEKQMKRDRPAEPVPIEKQYHPTMPHLGALERWRLERHTFVDRIMERWTSKRIAIVGDAPVDLPAHVTANVLRPKSMQTGWDEPVLEWSKIENARDDWNMSLVYAEIAAAIKCGLDSLHLRAEVRAAMGDTPRGNEPPVQTGGHQQGWHARLNPPGDRSAFKPRGNGFR